MIPSLFILALLSFSLLHKRFAVAEGPTECADSEMDWYMGAVGETPCTTYQRLRQICDPTYRVETLNTSLPPETCDGRE
ncbi:hypothetical protein VKT23_012422 [Stygiomarasmius scandens]|uniref:Uncharacterized protein n=1 Tax=Marasmiellus scandens TaxID=2682957 RepID=A0ABR1JA24_9AGAR